eukprot:TRINITY_DN2807_c0_g1_i1.p1 TRINITY_DN2807_c0_g1~~TRINITY_DN2807_c0_g1_i1.p1  ORF type:complete len:196 (-),score=43.58 TRINITY_DN2807_c0_g1_i1:33-569(-)
MANKHVEQDFSILDEIETKRRGTSSNETVIYFVSGFFTSVVPIYLYTTLFNMSLKDYGPFFGVMSVVVTILLSMAYQNVTQSIALRLVYGLSPAKVSKTLSKKDAKEKREELRAVQETTMQYKAVAFSLIYNNLFYLMLSVFFSFYLFRSFGGLQNYVVALGAAAGLVYFASTKGSGK